MIPTLPLNIDSIETKCVMFFKYTLYFVGIITYIDKELVTMLSAAAYELNRLNTA